MASPDQKDVTNSVTDLVIRMISDKSTLHESFVMLYATLLGALYRIIGIEFGAHLIQTLVISYRNVTMSLKRPPALLPHTISPSSNAIYESPNASKESLNLLVLLSELYNAHIISATLIYDLIRTFAEADPERADQVMGEIETESILKVLKCEWS